tara:strand:- start:154 stop:2061 length:1908 start_codon:yes stop_codon:yes gene_type:complete
LADEIDIKAIMDGENPGKVPQWATEATLQNLVAALDEGSKKSGSGAKKAKKATDDFSASLTKAVPGPGKLASAAMDAAAGVVNFGTTLVKAALSTTGDLDTFADTIRAGGEALAGVLENIPFVGGILGSAARATAEVQALTLEIVSGLEKEFAGLAIQGADFGVSLNNMNTRAMESRVNLDKLTGIVQDQGFTLASFGGTVQDGVDNFLQLNKAVTSTDMNFRTLGLRFDEVAQMTADYVEIQARAGRQLQGDSQAEAEAVRQYIIRTATLAKLQGKAADQVSEELRQANLDGAVQAKLMTMDSQAAENFTFIAQDLRAKFGEVGELAVQELLTAGTVSANTGKILSTAGVDIAKFMDNFFTAMGATTDQDLASAQANLVQGLGEAFFDETSLAIASLGKFNTGAADLADITGKIAPLRQLLAEEGAIEAQYLEALRTAKAQADLEIGDETTKDLLDAGQDIEISGFQTRNTILGQLTEDGTLANFVTQMAIASTGFITDIIDEAFGSVDSPKEIQEAYIDAGKVILTERDIETPLGIMKSRQLDANLLMTDEMLNLKGGRVETKAKSDARSEIRKVVLEQMGIADVDKSGTLDAGEQDELIKALNTMIEQNSDLASIMKKVDRDLLKSLNVSLE